MLEQRETARKEMERQRQIEWQKQRLQELMQQKQKENERVALLRARHLTLTTELNGLVFLFFHSLLWDKRSKIERKLKSHDFSLEIYHFLQNRYFPGLKDTTYLVRYFEIAKESFTVVRISFRSWKNFTRSTLLRSFFFFYFAFLSPLFFLEILCDFWRGFWWTLIDW